MISEEFQQNICSVPVKHLIFGKITFTLKLLIVLVYEHTEVCVYECACL